MAYPYRGAPLTPAIIAELVEQCFPGREIKRDQIVREISRIHTERGGRAPQAQSLAASVKRALQYLRQRGVAENVSTGIWRIRPAQARDSTSASVSADAFPTTPPAENDSEIQLGSVYLYYLPLYKRSAEKGNESHWPCKIGKSARDPLARILSQAATALPEVPEVALVFDTEYASALETALHSILTVRGKRIEGSPGNEWFLTSPSEVAAIVASIDPRLRPRKL